LKKRDFLFYPGAHMRDVCEVKRRCALAGVNKLLFYLKGLAHMVSTRHGTGPASLRHNLTAL
jgi:hypothetical protein